MSTAARSTATTSASACRRRSTASSPASCPLLDGDQRGARAAHRRAVRPASPAASGCGRRSATGASAARAATDGEEVVAAAAALELFQACALIHDDVMDGSDTRRGQPAVHRRFASLHRARGAGAATRRRSACGAAILLGDLCLSWSDEMLGRSGLPTERLLAGAPGLRPRCAPS